MNDDLDDVPLMPSIPLVVRQICEDLLLMSQSIAYDTSAIDSESELLHVLIPQLTHFLPSALGRGDRT